jgi:RyR domain
MTYIPGDAAVRIARTAHEANRAWCEFNGDDSQPVWDDAPEWQQKSAIAGVRFHAANPEAGDSASHDSWMQEKLNDGWKYGEVKDPAAKTHPCLVPFEELPLDQQFKDRLFRTIVHAAAHEFN